MFRAVHCIEIESTEPGGETFYITKEEAPFVVNALRGLGEGGALQLTLGRAQTDGVLSLCVLGGCYDFRRQRETRVSRRSVSIEQAEKLLLELRGL
jgi:hypothetical protein